LKISDGENPLDETWIHPESYETAGRVLEKIGCDAEQLAALLKSKRGNRPPQAPLAGKASLRTGRAEADAAATEAATSVLVSAADPAAPPSGPFADQAPLDAQELPPADAFSTAESSPVTMEAVTVEPESIEPVAQETVSVSLGAADVVTADVVTTDVVTTGPVDESPELPMVTATVTPGDEADQTGTEPNGGSLLTSKLAAMDVAQFATELNVGELLLRDIMAALARPGRDPREDLSPPAFRREILKLENLKPGMELSGTVLNVVDFGAFVDIGLSDSGLIHVSRLADRFVSDPHEVVSVGDILNVWVVDVDEKRRRVSLTAIEPGKGTERAAGREARAHDADRRPPQKRRKPRRPEGEAAVAGVQGGQSLGAGPDGQAGHGRPGGRPGTARQPARDSRGRRPAGQWKPKPKAPPKPVVPITDAMADGREPMRTFSDLQQFYARKKERGPTDPGASSSKE
jgi:uncharacterized protein